MLIDAHAHIWAARFEPRYEPPPGVPQYGVAWKSDVTLDAVDAEMTAAGVTGVVLVQAVNDLDHTDDLLDAAEAAARPTKVVGWLPLSDPERTAQALKNYAARGALAGVRHRMFDDDDPRMFVQPEVSHSLEHVANAGLVLDVLPWREEVLVDIPVLAARFPELPIVIDLLGWPSAVDQHMQPWTDHIAAAAAAPNVSIKVGGLHQQSIENAHPERWDPYVSTAVEVFGTDRMMVGSSWPTDNPLGITYTYAQYIATALATFHDLTPAEHSAITHDTAARIYRFR